MTYLPNLIKTFIATLGLVFYFSELGDKPFSLLFCLIALGVYLIITKSKTIENVTLKKCTRLSSVFAALIYLIGHCYERDNTILHLIQLKTQNITELSTLYFHLVMLVAFYILFNSAGLIVFNFVTTKSFPKDNSLQRSYFCGNIRSYFVLWAIIFVCWLPCYISYYPGTFSYDIWGQYQQAVANSYDRFQTTAHTFFFAITIKIAEILGAPSPAVDGSKTLAVYAITQMILLSGMFAYAVHYFARRRYNLVFRIITLAYFALNPAIALISFATTKAPLFAGFFVVATIGLIEFCNHPKAFWRIPRKYLCLGLFIILCCLFRNNAMYAFLLSAIALFVKKDNMKLLAVYACSIVVYSIIFGPVYTALGVGKGDPKEALSVPIQQIAWVYEKNQKGLFNDGKELSPQEVSDLEAILRPWRRKGAEASITEVNPRYADITKNEFDVPLYLQEKKKYQKLWFSLFKRYPIEYIDMAVALNVSYWFPDVPQPGAHASLRYIEDYRYSVEDFVFPDIDRKQFLHKLYEPFVYAEFIQTTPVISLIYSLGIPIWALTFAALTFIMKKRKQFIIVLLPAIFLWLTYLAGPISNFRYIFPIMACYPLYFALLFQKNKHRQTN